MMIIIKVMKTDSEMYEMTILREDGSMIQLEIDEATLAEYSLLKGRELSEDEFVTVLKASEMRKLYTKAIMYLSRQRRTVQEVYTFLQKDEQDEILLKKVLEKLIEQNYINDRDYANDYTQTAKKVSYKGPNLIRTELLQKGIGQSLINISLQDYSLEEQIICAEKWAQKKKVAFSKYSFTEREIKLRQLLMRKGFPNEVIQIVIETMKQAESEDEEAHELEWANLLATAKKYERKYEKFDDFTKRQKLFTALARKGFSFESIDDYLNKQEDE